MEAVIHGNRKRKLVNATENKVKYLVVELKKDKYVKANITYKTSLFQSEIISLAQDGNINKAAILAFRGSGISTIISLKGKVNSIDYGHQNSIV